MIVVTTDEEGTATCGGRYRTFYGHVEIPDGQGAPRCDRANNSHVESPERAVPVTGQARSGPLRPAQARSMRSVVSTSECLRVAHAILYYSIPHARILRSQSLDLSYIRSGVLACRNLYVTDIATITVGLGRSRLLNTLTVLCARFHPSFWPQPSWVLRAPMVNLLKSPISIVTRAWLPD